MTAFPADIRIGSASFRITQPSLIGPQISLSIDMPKPESGYRNIVSFNDVVELATHLSRNQRHDDFAKLALAECALDRNERIFLFQKLLEPLYGAPSTRA